MEPSLSDFALTRAIIPAALYFTFADELDDTGIVKDERMIENTDFVPTQELKEAIVGFAFALHAGIQLGLETAESVIAFDDGRAWQASIGTGFERHGYWHRIANVMGAAAFANADIPNWDGPFHVIMRTIEERVAASLARN